MQYEVVADRTIPESYRVEAIDYENDGACYVAIFSGPLAKERAEEYANWGVVPKVARESEVCILNQKSGRPPRLGFPNPLSGSPS